MVRGLHTVHVVNHADQVKWPKPGIATALPKQTEVRLALDPLRTPSNATPNHALVSAHSSFDFWLKRANAIINVFTLYLESTYCYTTNTGFQDDGDGDAVYLDRHTLHCAAGYLINYVKLERNSGHNKIKYTYKCCKSQLSCSDSTTTNGRSYNGGGQGNSVYLDRQSIQCYNKGLSYLKLARSGNYWNYKYDCCKVSYASSSVYCYSKSTGFANDGDGESVYLDRHTISCNSQTDFVTYMKMSRNRGHDKVKYDYKCCRINTPSRTNW